MKKSNLNVEYWFPTPIWNYNLETINRTQYEEAIEYCNELKRNSPGRKVSNYGGWQSNDLLRDVLSTPLAPFLKEIRPLFADLLASIGSSVAVEYVNVWVNINKKGDKNTMHTHPSTSFAGVFYLTDNNSEIVFERECGIALWWQACLASKNDTLSTFKQVIYEPKRGNVLIFPPWLQHAVRDNEQDDDRISIAFNISTYNAT